MMKNGRKSGFDDIFGDDRDNGFGDEFSDEFGEELDEDFDNALDETWDEESEADEDASEFAPAPDWTVDELLRRLSVAPDDVPLNEYFALSDLTREEVETVRRHWGEIDVASRLRTVDVLARGVEEFLNVDIGAFLAAIIDDPDADVRQLVLETLNENEPQPELLGPIIHRLQHDSADEVRAAAAAVLGHYVLAGELDELDAAPAIRAEDALFAVLTDANEPMIVQCRALESIAYSGEIAVRQFIEDAYYSPWEEMRVSALTAMGRSADIRWRRMARAELRNPSPAMRAEAAIACGELEAKAALSDLLDLLADDEQPVRLAAIFALGRIGGKQARRALEEIAASDDEEALEAELALEDMLFYTGADAAAIPLFDEREDEDVLDDLDPWDDWDDDDDDLGEYE